VGAGSLKPGLSMNLNSGQLNQYIPWHHG
jgi:hypothetical protein